MVPAGLGLGFAIPSLTVMLLDAIPADQAGLAAGMLNSSRQIGGTLAVAVFGAMVSGRAHFVSGLRGSILIGALMLLAATVAALTLPGQAAKSTKMD
jgi:DHA2 family methylenomycin A resistance protein-like MFS transporter